MVEKFNNITENILAILAFGRNARTCIRGILVIESLGPHTGCFENSEKGSRDTSDEVVLPLIVNHQYQFSILKVGLFLFYHFKEKNSSPNNRSLYYRKIRLFLSCLGDFICSVLYYHLSLPYLSFSRVQRLLSTQTWKHNLLVCACFLIYVWPRRLHQLPPSPYPNNELR